MRPAALLLAGAILLASPTQAQLPMGQLFQGAGFDQKLDSKLPLDTEFLDEAGRKVRLEDYFGKRPVILALVYYECPMLCTVVLNGLVKSLKAITFQPGTEFEIVTVSFDPGETPALAAEKKAAYLKMYGRPGAAAGWHFLTGDEPSIRRLANAIGFRYVYDAENDEYAHPGGIVVVTPEGRTARYFYGFDYNPKHLRLGLVEASAGKIGSPVDQLVLLCYRYDPVSGRYGLVIMNVLKLAAVATVLGLAALIYVLSRKDRKRLGT